MQQSPDPCSQYPQKQWQQQNTNWGSSPQWQQSEPLPPQYQQQPSYSPEQQWQQPPRQQWNPQHPPQHYPQHQWYIQPPKEPKRKWYQRLFAWCRRHPIATAVIIIVFLLIGVIGSITSPQTSTDTPTVQATQAAQGVTAIAQDNQTLTPTQKPTIAPTQKPVPTVSAAELEATYKASTTDTTIATLDKDGNADQGKDVHFTCTILNFVKDSNGNTAGANVDDPNTSGVVQTAFPANTDLSRLNTGDILEVWGTDGGTASGQNAFGATIQEVVVSANYMTDKTTNYQANG